MKISQREARRLRKRVQELERQEEVRRRTWSREYPGGTNFHSFDLDDVSTATVATAQALGHAIVCTISGRRLMFFALPPAK
jgi:hypothetical protein